MVTGRLMQALGIPFLASLHDSPLCKPKLAGNQFLNFHGEPGARLSRRQSVHDENSKPRSRMMRLASLLMFSAPDVYLQALDQIWVDYVAKLSLWEEFIRKLNTEWQEFIIIVSPSVDLSGAILIYPWL
jgi:hypothetical protein